MEHPRSHSRSGGPELDPAHKIGVVAIAKDEGAYIADWIHHHIYFGFDCVNVWVNGTSDETTEILRRINDVHPQVQWENADELMSRSMAGAGMFQHLAYEGLLRWGEREGCSHLLFIDIDEMWTPLDFSSSIREFVKQNPLADVISFPWFLDLPDLTREPFTSTFETHQLLSPNHHVKSLIRVTESIKKVTTHSAELDGGERLLVDSAFDMPDPAAQVEGAKLSASQFQSVASETPRAFITHWIYRSQLEYVAILGKGTAQAGSRIPIKKNRDGYLLRTAARTEFDIEPVNVAGYRESRLQFVKQCELEDLIERARASVVAEAARVVEFVAKGTDFDEIVDRAMAGVDQTMLGRTLGQDRMP